jgi:hypothetical protein
MDRFAKDGYPTPAGWHFGKIQLQLKDVTGNARQRNNSA